jgi:hypothetical protein
MAKNLASAFGVQVQIPGLPLMAFDLVASFFVCKNLLQGGLEETELQHPPVKNETIIAATTNDCWLH